MKIARKVFALLIIFILTIVASACEEKSVGEEGYTAKFESGTVAAVGDYFVLPEISAKSGAPIISGATSQVASGDSITVSGKGFSQSGLKVYLYSQSKKNNGKAHELSFDYISDTQIVAKVSADIEYGIYVLYVTSDNGTSNIKVLNNPKINWIGFTKVLAGETVSVYGENLTTENKEGKTNIWLTTDAGFYKVNIKYANPYKVTFEVPRGLESKEYGVVLHNGHGGELGFAKSEEKLSVVTKRFNQFLDGNVINVKDFGALPDDKTNDDSGAVQDAITSAKEGDTIYFPNGTYVFESTVYCDKPLKFLGESHKETVMVSGTNLSGGVVEVSAGPCEVSNISFVCTRAFGKLPDCFIRYKGNFPELSNGSWEINVHDCRFSAKGGKTANADIKPVRITSANGILLQNNECAAPGMYAIYENYSTKIFINNNVYYGQCYAGTYHSGMNAFTTRDINCADISDNYMASADILTDKTHALLDGDLINGRSMSMQGRCFNVYVGTNKIEASDIPGYCAGEQILCEGYRDAGLFNVLSATKNTVQLEGFEIGNLKSKIAIGDRLNVCLGTGDMQVKFIEAIKGDTVTLTEPFDVIPDKSSRVSLSAGQYNFMIYNNDISLDTNHSKSGGGGCGVMIYNDAYNFQVVKNKIKNSNTGIYLESHMKFNAEDIEFPMICEDSINRDFSGSRWCILSENNISDCNVGIRSMVNNMPKPTQKEILMHFTCGVTIRKNNISNIVDWEKDNLKTIGGVGIMYGRTSGDYNNSTSSVFYDWPGDWMYGAVIENNTFKNCARANILLGAHQGKTLLLNNAAEGTVKEIWTLDSGKYHIPVTPAEPFICR